MTKETKLYQMTDTNYISSIIITDECAVLKVWHPAKRHTVRSKHANFKAARAALARWGAATLIKK